MFSSKNEMDIGENRNMNVSKEEILANKNKKMKSSKCDILSSHHFYALDKPREKV